jgi:predicted membrane protein
MGTQQKGATQIINVIRILLQAGLLIFTFTVVVGILNGLDIIEFERPMLMAHVHAGTLGWITLGMIAACFWMFSAGEQLSGWRATAPNWISWISIVSIAVYAYAFYTGDLDFRLAGGSLTLIAILAVYIWLLSQSRQVRLTIPRLGMLTAATTLTLGAAIGVLMGIYLVGGLPDLPQGIFATHFTFLVVGYLILAGLAFAEWGLRSQHKPLREEKLGVAQIAFPFIGGLIISVGAFLDNQMVIGMFVPVEFITVIIVVIRLGREVLRAPWAAGGPKRYFAASIIFAILNVAFLSTLVINFVSGKYGEDFSLIPLWLIFAMDHAMFIGVLTNGLFALVHIATQERSSRFSWADQVIFWAVNVGMVGFVVGLAMDSAAIKQLFSPLMGGGILLAIIVFTVRMQIRGGLVSQQ